MAGILTIAEGLVTSTSFVHCYHVYKVLYDMVIHTK